MRCPSLLVLLIQTLLLLAAPWAASAEGNSSAEGVDSVTFTLFDNGASTGGVEVTLTEFPTSPPSDDAAPPGEAFAIAMSSRIEVQKYLAPKPVLATRAYREDGELVTSLDQLRPLETSSDSTDDKNNDDNDGATSTPIRHRHQPRRVYLVAEDLDYIWPFVSLGHRQTVSPNVVPHNAAGPVVLESFSDSPRVFRVYNMATEEEADGIIATALGKSGDDALKRSTVGSGKSEDGEDLAREDIGRTSENSWDSESAEAQIMIARSFNLTNIADDGGKRDGLQVVRYTPGQGYNTHPDYFTSKDDDDGFDFLPYSGGSNRFATVFMYLNEPAEGGHTVFPKAEGLDPNAKAPQHALDMFKEGSWEKIVTNQCYTKLSVPPKKGTAALFYSVTSDGRIDHKSLHAACPLIDGTKWGANIWIWNKQRYGDIRTGDPRTINISNESGETVYLSWERKNNGSIEPGKGMVMNTFEFHRFQVAFGSHKEKSIADYTVQSEPEKQVWKIERPRKLNVEVEVQAGKKKKQRVKEKVEKMTAPSAGNNQISVHITHTSTEALCIAWKGSKLFVLAPGEETTMNTFPGHEFEASVGAFCDGPVVEKYAVPATAADYGGEPLEWYLNLRGHEDFEAPTAKIMGEEL